MNRSVLFAAVVATAMLSGCNATMGELNRGVDNLARSAQAAVTPQEVLVYRAHADAARPILDGAIGAMKKAGVTPRVQSVKVSFRDPIGRVFESPLTVSSYRFAVPQDVIDSDDKSLAPLVSAMGEKFVQWHAVEPIELVAISADAEGADELVTLLRKSSPGIKVTKQVGTASAVGYPGVELRMVNTNLSRVLANQTALK